MDETLIGYARCSTDEQDLTAQRQEHEALIRIDDSGTIRGDLPRTAARLVEQWRALYHDELLANWLLAQEPTALSGIEPLQ